MSPLEETNAAAAHESRAVLVTPREEPLVLNELLQPNVLKHTAASK